MSGEPVFTRAQYDALFARTLAYAGQAGTAEAIIESLLEPHRDQVHRDFCEARAREWLAKQREARR